MLKELIKNLIKLSPIPLTKNHKYDILTKKIIRRLSQDSNCIDVGCYKGEILDLMMAASPDGQHFGIEPVPIQYENLVKKYGNYPNCTIINVAASDYSGTTSFNFVASNPPYSGIKKRDFDRPHEDVIPIEVRTEPLDKLIQADLPIHLIKIDVEGAEMQVLKGARKLIEIHKPLVIFEHGMGASNHYGTTPEMIYAFFESCNMKISLLENFLHGDAPLSHKDFGQQYHQKINYYFVAHP